MQSELLDGTVHQERQDRFHSEARDCGTSLLRLALFGVLPLKGRGSRLRPPHPEQGFGEGGAGQSNDLRSGPNKGDVMAGGPSGVNRRGWDGVALKGKLPERLSK